MVANRISSLSYGLLGLYLMPCKHLIILDLETTSLNLVIVSSELMQLEVRVQTSSTPERKGETIFQAYQSITMPCSLLFPNTHLPNLRFCRPRFHSKCTGQARLPSSVQFLTVIARLFFLYVCARKHLLMGKVGFQLHTFPCSALILLAATFRKWQRSASQFVYLRQSSMIRHTASRLHSIPKTYK
jgi:hypothetical protein